MLPGNNRLKSSDFLYTYLLVTDTRNYGNKIVILPRSRCTGQEYRVTVYQLPEIARRACKRQRGGGGGAVGTKQDHWACLDKPLFKAFINTNGKKLAASASKQATDWYSCSEKARRTKHMYVENVSANTIACPLT
jgi:hypothetical protein